MCVLEAPHFSRVKVELKSPLTNSGSLTSKPAVFQIPQTAEMKAPQENKDKDGSTLQQPAVAAAAGLGTEIEAVIGSCDRMPA